ncbi:tyrosine-type recombinase/integrase [Nocardia grenadensis]|uniref:tyrosine-type recombinase/integrase n=1 Tax=Nocardia grenadensis TaxID=931537 RepID=UPI0024800C18|nr:tyrosine-type recombinase/integrase [Nocardia grenadensis]
MDHGGRPGQLRPRTGPKYPLNSNEDTPDRCRRRLLHQLRHSRFTHAAEDGASTPVLMKLSGHTSIRSLVRYARISDDGLRRYQADSDPVARRRR